MFFVTQFVDGLKAEIRSAVILHCHPDLDTALDLACLQEEVLETNQREVSRGAFAGGARGGIRAGIPVIRGENGADSDG